MGRIFVIAEAGVNHNGDLPTALRMVDAAAEAGADAVKFQTAVPELVVTRSAQKADYQKRSTGADESQLDMIRKLLLSLEQFRLVRDHCVARGIAFLSTAFDLTSLEFLIELGLSHHKIPSGEITNLPYLRRIGRCGVPVLMSTGMARLGEIEEALGVLTSAGTPRERVTVLHCHTDYPSRPEDVNLRAMQTIAAALQVPVGYSDHTMGIEVPIAAVALGATVIEKHFTLDRGLPGPDQASSLEPRELGEMVRAIRNVESALGDGVKRPTEREERIRPLVRRSIVASRAIKAGEVFGPDNLIAKRPGTGISAMRWDEVVGRSAPRDFAEDELIIL
jgi:N,N'-diacetyllegionaminate synthase